MGNQRGNIPVIFLLAALGLIVFILSSSTLPFKDNFFSSIFPKDETFAASCIDGRTAAPCLEKLEVVNTDALGSTNGNGGNGWGSNRLRSVRTGTDDLFVTVHADGTDNNFQRKAWLYRKTPTSGWSKVYDTLTGEIPAQVVKDSNNRVSVFGQPNQTPARWSDSGANWQTPINTENMSPNFPYQTSNPYNGVAVHPGNNNLWFVEPKTAEPYTAPNSYYFWGVKNASTGVWTKGQVNTDVRMLYFFVLPVPGTSSGAYVVAQSGPYWGDVGMTQPSGTSFPYVIDRVEMWYSPDWTTTAPTKSLVKRVFQSNGQYVNVGIADAYLDTNNKLHVLYQYEDNTGNAVRQSIYTGNTLNSDTPQSFTCGNNARMIQDNNGKFFVFSRCTDLYVYPGTDATGTQFGSPVNINVSQFPVSGWHSLAAPRGGTALSNVVDGVYSTNSDRQMAYFRIRLNDSAPTPTPSSQPSPLKVGDIIVNGKVDIFDYNQLLSDFGKTGTNLISDIYKTGSSLNKVDIFDYNLLLTNFGK